MNIRIKINGVILILEVNVLLKYININMNMTTIVQQNGHPKFKNSLFLFSNTEHFLLNIYSVGKMCVVK